MRAATLIAPPTANAADLVSCEGNNGNPPVTALPDVPVAVNAKGTIDLPTCTGAGITGAHIGFTGTSVSATCVPITNTVLGTVNAGSLTVTWNGGSGEPTTMFSWTVPAGLQLTLDTSVVALVGYSTAGRFHNAVTPAVMIFLIRATDAKPHCPGVANMRISGGSLIIADAA